MSNATASTKANRLNLAGVGIVKLLAILLIAQLSLAIILKLSEKNYQPVEPTAPLLTFDFNKINKIVIEQNDAITKTKISLVLEKDEHGWKLPSYFSFPASSDKVSKFITTLKDLKKGFPVSTSSSSIDHFHVGADNFERALSFYDGKEKLSTLYLGTTPRFRTTNARIGNSNDIFIVPLAQYELVTDAQGWIDRDVAALNPMEITDIDAGTFKLEKTDGNWKLLTTNKTQPLSQAVAQNFLDAISHLTIGSVVGPVKDVDLNTSEQQLSYKVTTKKGRIVTYSYFKGKEKGSYILKMSDNNWCFNIDNWAVDQIRKFTAESLMKSNAADKQSSQIRSPKGEKLPSLFTKHLH